MNWWEKPNVKCQCIREEWSGPTTVRPVKGQILTVIDWEQRLHRIGVAFKELDPDDMFDVSHFRPLVTHEQDIALFTEIAKTSGLDIELEQLEAAWRMSEADEMPAYGTVIADDADLRWIEEQARKGGGK